MSRTFEDIIADQDIVYVPIYSMVKRDTGKIDLTCDGNVNRWMTNFCKHKTWKSLRIVGPTEENSEHFKEFKSWFENLGNAEYVPSELVKISAKWQRENEFAAAIVDEVLQSDPTMIIIEGQGLAKKLVDSRSLAKIVYWCPVCKTNKKTRSFLEAAKETNERIFKFVDEVIVATSDQEEYIREVDLSKDAVVVSEFLDRSLPMFKYDVDTCILRDLFFASKDIIYLPFRLSDEGYKIWEIIEVLKDKDLAIWSSNVNRVGVDEIVKLCQKNSSLSESEIRDFIDKIHIVDSSRNAYYTILDYGNNVIIPYLEDIDFVMHAAVDELIRGKLKPKCKVVTTREDLEKEIKYEFN